MRHKLSATNSGLEVEATLDPKWVAGVGGETYPRLTFQVSLSVREDAGSQRNSGTQAVSFGMLTGELLVDTQKIGDARPLSIDRIGMHYHPYQDDIYQTVEIALDARRIEWLERNRSGRSMEGTLRIGLPVQVFGFLQNAPVPAFAGHFGLITVANIQGDIPFTIPDTHWRERVLPALGYGKVIVIELPAIGLDQCYALGQSFKSLEKARQHFDRGLYDEAVGACRLAMDPFFELVAKGDGSDGTIPKLKKSWETRLGDATYQWLEASLGAIKAAANKPHHSPNSHFDRLGAQLLLTVTTALIAYAAHHDTTA